MVNQVEEENSEKGLGIGNFVDVAYGMHEELVGDLSGGDGSQAEDVEPPIVLEPDLGYLIMALGQSQSIASQPSSSVPLPAHNSTSDSHTSQPWGNSPMITKLPIEFDEDGVAVGPNHAKWNTQFGIYVRSQIPIHYKDWRKIDGSFKDNVSNKLMEEFEPNVPQAIKTPKLKRTFPKSSDQESMPSWKEIFANKWRLLIKEEKKQALVVRIVMEVDFDNDEFMQVFGPDKGSRTRGISSNKSKKQLQRVLPRHYCKQANSSSILKLKGK
ncbi:hypothetical protein IFM89_014559 [Coptis chinensis]|uniref:Uncharacterized protein n=1 Tax=Coptis chinensis TaxID=261450 RepID=A0A835LHY9_9MAGN|nr:hypothetical protein IFM89_014559 [Coptis chinensis]